MQGDVKSKPILFNTAMVQAILDGRKTVTRRVIKPKPESFGNALIYNGAICTKKGVTKEAPYQVGDILWVRETWLLTDSFGPWNNGYMYKADEDKNKIVFENTGQVEKWRPPIHMPKEAARIFLKVTDVRVERLQDIDKFWSSYDKEGMRNKETENISIAMKERFIGVWDSTIKKKDLDEFRWDANPWVWVIEFERCENAN
ncbi:hypothetical protein [Acetobacterium sp.]|uniref:hypothetical protein n=1 Tax=Acetobacterium sp. TaxID=1872094 RepID=UPI002716E02D|nr:hypothetical protein [Acetobacterium sp.]MDO9492820.1 hypothetical protein [Acetobacterium sp.]